MAVNRTVNRVLVRHRVREEAQADGGCGRIYGRMAEFRRRGPSMVKVSSQVTGAGGSAREPVQHARGVGAS